MLLELRGLLQGEELQRVRDLAATANFSDGRATAGARIAPRKHNEQVADDPELLAQVHQLLMQRLLPLEAFRNAVYPKHMHGLMLARYRAGMSYGWHVDDALMGQGQVFRSDLSMTVFLSTPEEYEGGALEIRGASGAARFKLGAGDAIVYRTGDLHQVQPVHVGERLVIVCWIESFVRDADLRATLFDLANARDAVFQSQGANATFDLINKAHANLLRRYAET